MKEKYFDATHKLRITLQDTRPEDSQFGDCR